MPPRTIRVEGLADLQRAFRVASKEMGKDLKMALESTGEPVRQSAESLAATSIGIGTVPWHTMRTGVTRSSVYVAPRMRGRRSAIRRPNFARKLLAEALEPALERNRGKAEQEFQDAIDDMARAWSRV